MHDDPAPRPSFFVIPIDVKRRLKIAAARTGKPMKQIVTAALLRELERIEGEERAGASKLKATGT